MWAYMIFDMKRQSVVTLASLAVLLFLLAMQPAAGQSGTYDISVEGSIDTPDRDISFDGESYQVSAVKQADSGDSVTVNVEAPSDKLVNVYIYNSDRQIVDKKDVLGTGSVSFDLTDYAAGSYMFTIQYSGSTKDIHPLVVRSYDVSLTAPDEATTDESIDLSSTLTELRSSSMSGVDFVIANDDNTLRVDGSESDGAYKGTADLSSLNTGEYSVYSTVRGTEDVDGYKVRLGFSEPHSLTITESSTDTGDSGSDGSDSDSGGTTGGSGAVDSGSDTTTTTQTQKTTSTSENTETVSTTTVPAGNDNPTTRPETTQAGSGNRTTSTATTDSSVITPEPSPSNQQTTTTETGPGFGLELTGVALVAVAIGLFARRSRSD